MIKKCAACGKEFEGENELCPECAEKKENAASEAAAEENAVTESAAEETGGNESAGSTEEKSAEKKSLIGMVKSAVRDKKTDKTLIIIIAAAIALLIMIISVITSSGTPYLKPVDRYISAAAHGNALSYYQAFPSYVIKDISETESIFSYVKSLHDDLKDFYGWGVRVSYKVTSKSKLYRDDLEDTKEFIEMFYEKRAKVTDGYELELSVTIKGSEDSCEEEVDVTVYKIDGKWVILEDIWL